MSPCAFSGQAHQARPPTGRLLERFRAEGQILATLEHANIARLIDAGPAGNGRPYLAMEYVDGSPIDRYSQAQVATAQHRMGRLRIARSI